MSATDRKLESIRRSLKAGFTFGPRRSCACCGETSDDSDSIDRGICLRCWTALNIPANTP
jgi:hypothetical protein